MAGMISENAQKIKISPKIISWSVHSKESSKLRATKYARHVWYLREELENFLKNKTETQ